MAGMLTFTHHPGREILFRLPGGASGSYRYAADLARPCLHPLVTPAGHTVTAFEPADHLWHRGVWFTIKFVNGVNFWEENGPAVGRQVTAAVPSVARDDAGRLVIAHELRWTSDSTGDVLRETRQLGVHQMAAADRSPLLVVEWRSDLLALQDLLLDRTPYTTWGGYGGFTFRGAEGMRDLRAILPDGASETAVVAHAADWVVIEGTTAGGARVSVGLGGHDSNPRSRPGPEAWYGKAVPEYVFMNASFLFHAARHVARGETLSFRYVCVVGDGALRVGEWADLFSRWRQG
jgi:hypothetical protein